MNQFGGPMINVFRLIASTACSLIAIAPAFAHHGGGTFDNTRTIERTGTLAGLELVNPIGRWDGDVLVVETVGFL